MHTSARRSTLHSCCTFGCRTTVSMIRSIKFQFSLMGTGMTGWDIWQILVAVVLPHSERRAVLREP